MSHITVLDSALVLGICVLGWFLAVRLKTKYNVARRDFFAVSFFVAGLSVIVIGVYHLLRGLLIVSP